MDDGGGHGEAGPGSSGGGEEINFGPSNTDGARGKRKASARPTSNKKAQKKGDMADDADIGIGRLTPKQVLTVEKGFQLETGGTLKERERRAADFLKSKRAELKAAKNGNISDEAVDRGLMQLVCATLVKLPNVCGMSGERYLTEWRKLMKRDLDEEFDSLEDGIGWLIGVLQCKTRAAAIGTSAGGARQATRSGKDLHMREGLEKALEALKAANSKFAEWYAPHTSLFTPTTLNEGLSFRFSPHTAHSLVGLKDTHFSPHTSAHTLLTSAQPYAHAQDVPRAPACAHLERRGGSRTRVGWAKGGRDAVGARPLRRLLLR